MIYFIGNSELNVCKIGYSRRPYRRINTLRSQSPFDLEILDIIEGSIQDEKMYHSRYMSHKIKGEWFKLNKVIELGFNTSIHKINIGHITLNQNKETNYIHVASLLATLNMDRINEHLNVIDFNAWKNSNKVFIDTIPDSIIKDACFWCHEFIAYELIRNSTIKNKILLYSYLLGDNPSGILKTLEINA